MNPSANTGALAGVKIVDLSRVLGGPYCTQILADLGAEVIKLEPPDGDETRLWGVPVHRGASAYFTGINRNKKMLAADLRQDAGKALLLRLLQEADVLVHNFKTGTLEKWGLGYDEVLRQRFPRLIYCHVTGFGDTGPLGGLPGYDGAAQLGTPPRLYNQIIRKVAAAKGNDTAKNARLFALINVAMADAGALAWDQKYIHDFWRPVVAIREHDVSEGPAATVGANEISDDGDPFWLPLGAPKSNALGKNFTPPFPAYPSGHATFGAAAFQIARLFYGVPPGKSHWKKDNLFNGLNFVSEELNGVTTDNKGAVRPRHVRSFPDGLWQMIVENGLSRVYLGVHWVFDAFAAKGNGDPDLDKRVGGVRLGLAIAEDIFASGMKKSLAIPPR